MTLRVAEIPHILTFGVKFIFLSTRNVFPDNNSTGNVIPGNNNYHKASILPISTYVEATVFVNICKTAL
jgi:hypothetical protein